ncbi:MAG: MFS transporter, partial [Victivallaceae bacterium]
MNASSPAETPKIWKVGTLTYTVSGVVTLFFLLLLGDFAISLKDRSIGPVMQLLFRQFGASNFTIGLVLMSLPSAIGFVIGPVISYKSDRCRTRIGRRLPFLLVATPIAAGSMAGMAFSPKVGAWLGPLFGFPAEPTVLVLLTACWVVYEFAAITAASMFSALINDVLPAVLMGRFYGLFRAVSLVDGILFSYFILGHAEEYYVFILAGLGLVYGTVFLVMCFKIKEGEYPPPPAPVAPGRIAAIKGYFKDCYSQSHYRLAFAYFALASLALGSFGNFAILYAKQLQVPMALYGKAAAVMLGVSLVLSYFLGAVADRFHPLRAALAMLVIYAATLLGGFFLVTDTASFLIVYTVQGVVAGSYGTVSASLPMRILPRSAFAQFNSAAGLVTSCCQVLYLPALGKFLDLTGHQYIYTFMIGSVTGLAAVSCGLIFYRRFKDC